MIKIYDLVKGILSNNIEARDSDKTLFLEVLKKLNLIEHDFTNILGHKVTISNWENMPQFESITRARRKVQENNPELRGKNYKVGKRLEKQLTKDMFVYHETI